MAPPLTGCALRLHHTTPLTAQRPGRGPGRGQRALVPLAAYSVTLQLPGGRTATFKTSGGEGTAPPLAAVAPPFTAAPAGRRPYPLAPSTPLPRCHRPQRLRGCRSLRHQAARHLPAGQLHRLRGQGCQRCAACCSLAWPLSPPGTLCCHGAVSGSHTCTPLNPAPRVRSPRSR